MGAESAGVTLLRGDITSREEVERALDEHEVTHVIHLAALQIPFCRADPIRGALVNVVGTLNVLEAVKERRDRIAGPVVYASSAALLRGLQDVEAAATDEAARSRPDTHYGVYKQANEGNARIYWQDAAWRRSGCGPPTCTGPPATRASRRSRRTRCGRPRAARATTSTTAAAPSSTTRPTSRARSCG